MSDSDVEMKMPHQETASRIETVAVIIPYYNGSKYIRRSAESVLAQTVPATEFVVVDDGSSPEEAALLDEIAQSMGFRVLRKENGGQGTARNYGVAHTSSRFICFLDQDDFYLKTHIATLLDAVPLDDPHFGWVYGDLMEADGEGNIVRSDMVKQHALHPKRFINDLLANDMFVLPSASLIERTAFEAVGGFDPQFTGYEDDDLFLRIFRRGYTNYFVDKAVTVWCINSESTSYSIKMSRSRLRYVKKLCSQFPDDVDKRRNYVRDLIAPRFTHMIISDAFTAVAFSKTPQQKKMAAYKDELVEIMNGYVETIFGCTKLSIKNRIAIYVQSKIINLKSKNLSLAALYLFRTSRRARNFIR
ncbi:MULTISPECIES: glycosyltransferase family 2 protein [Rhizobium]|uniref:Glycosyltransferase family A protein n=1 Tax=Rhizobium rhododendri TaxID=2506430 RepID=A0ABY8IJH4_9HYPH|nr:MULTISPECIES: glycosyltransferase family A protein [Rhizobium]MBZ5760000.1 glycosyltransferase family 2 protein [Rhizobium sp. VS19-DR96]MBZ5766519.1 glycosyltransferase family 2 protein [Rhizobium sp. VS19-DR129.2]MBZ5774138.1 glycosyltransferase family 2 protein [Rhizobium sp. VS19-DRK62.2]MBZ5785210.1 glycosyltransferase family 2 protein [Rhizobium sp. VS19-DR121]MBZ5802809.1 glycosyltransferase family 2 protein [Rhizobium sp. VS19-DR181]